MFTVPLLCSGNSVAAKIPSKTIMSAPNDVPSLTSRTINLPNFNFSGFQREKGDQVRITITCWDRIKATTAHMGDLRAHSQHFLAVMVDFLQTDRSRLHLCSLWRQTIIIFFLKNFLSYNKSLLPDQQRISRQLLLRVM